MRLTIPSARAATPPTRVFGAETPLSRAFLKLTALPGARYDKAAPKSTWSLR